MILDIKRKAKHYRSDFVDALNSQCLATILFIYFAVLAPIVTFGGVMETKTDKYMVSHSMVTACLRSFLLAYLPANNLSCIRQVTLHRRKPGCRNI